MCLWIINIHQQITGEPGPCKSKPRKDTKNQSKEHASNRVKKVQEQFITISISFDSLEVDVINTDFFIVFKTTSINTSKG